MMQTVRTMLEHVGVADVNNVEQASIITEILTKKFRAMHDREPETTEETNLIRSFAQIHARLQQAHAALQRQNGDKDTSNKSPNAPHDNAVPPAA
jgi:glycine cleavage system pyridoxal-binding protein P